MTSADRDPHPAPSSVHQAAQPRRTALTFAETELIAHNSANSRRFDERQENLCLRKTAWWG